jgi:hypothetical protein
MMVTRALKRQTKQRSKVLRGRKSKFGVDDDNERDEF